MAVASLAIVATSASANTTPLDLTGTWANVAAPIAPDWALDASADRSTLTAQWHGAYPHQDLTGSYTGTASVDGTSYSGPFHIHEDATVVDGTLTVAITSASAITVTLTPTVGAPSTISFTKVTTAVEPPATSWCPSVKAVARRSARGVNCDTAVADVPPGGEVVEASPDLTKGQTTASIDVASKDAVHDEAMVDIQITHASQCVGFAYSNVAVFGLMGQQQAITDGDAAYTSVVADVAFMKFMLMCLDGLHERTSKLLVRAHLPGCHVNRRLISVKHKGSTYTWTTLHKKRAVPVVVTCTRSAGHIVLHLKAAKHHTLAKLFGKRILVGVYHRSTAHATTGVSSSFGRR
jgi:hypothetical protein